MTLPNILLSAGEASSDMYAAQLATALRKRSGANIFGMGGKRMAEAGVELIADYHEVAVVGITEVLHKIPTVIGVQRRLAREAIRRKASLAILVDSPGTHLGVARRVKNAGIPVGYFIGPQIWAWRPGRVRMVKLLVKRMVVIFPFEETIYREAGVPVSFVGHPLVDIVRPTRTRADFAAAHGLDPKRPTVALLPGSRKSEITRNFPTILEACSRLANGTAAIEGIQFIHAAAPGFGAEFWDAFTRKDFALKRVESATYDILNAADCAIVASGTATVEAALIGTPMVIVYRVAAATAMVLRRMLKTPFIGMVNLIAGRLVAPELVQNGFTAQAVEREVRQLLESSQAHEEAKSGLAEVRAKLGPGGAIDRAADIFAAML
ncbi:MAG: lipid-A-disaccharide synthase [Candidatus Acidiferrales bacterium]